MYVLISFPHLSLQLSELTLKWEAQAHPLTDGRPPPQAVVTSVAKEIARYNNLATNAQALNVNIAQHVLTRSKAEILHLVELLIGKCRGALVDLLVDVVDIVLHCVDHNHLKSRPMSEVFAPACQFPQVG